MQYTACELNSTRVADTIYRIVDYKVKELRTAVAAPSPQNRHIQDRQERSECGA